MLSFAGFLAECHYAECHHADCRGATPAYHKIEQIINFKVNFMQRLKLCYECPSWPSIRHDRTSRQPTNLKQDVSIPVLPVLCLTSW